MKSINKLFLGLLFVPMTLLTSCLDSNNNNDDAGQRIMSVFATLTTKTETGMVFTTSEYQGSPIITYTTPVYEQFKGEVGKRYVIWFYKDATETTPYVSGAVNLQQTNEPFYGNVQFASLEEIKNNIHRDAYCMYRHAGTGYLDITFYAPIEKEPKMFGAYVDQATADSAFPDVYLCYQPDLSYGTPQTFFGSFNMTDLFDRTTCEGFNLHFRSNNGTDYVQKFFTNGDQPEVPKPVQ